MSMLSIPGGSRYEAETDVVRERERRQYAERAAVTDSEARIGPLRIAQHERSEGERERKQIELRERQRLESVERVMRRQEQVTLEKEEGLPRRRERRDEVERAARRGLRLPREQKTHDGKRFLPALHPQNLRQDNDSFEEREETFLREAIREAIIKPNLRQFERQGSSKASRSRFNRNLGRALSELDDGESNINAPNGENTKGARADETEDDEGVVSIDHETGSSLSEPLALRTAVTIDCLWDLTAFTRTEISADQTLGTVLTLTGTGKEVYATTCEEYMKWRWPKTGLVTLEFVEALLKGQKGKKISRPGLEMTPNVVQSGQERWEDATVKEQDPPTFGQAQEPWNNVREQEHPRVVIRVSGPESHIFKTIEQIAWLSAVFRPPLFGQVSSSRSGLQTTRPGELEISLHDMQPLIKNDTETSCWLELFVNSVVAQEFPIPTRHFKGNEGIELPFSTMVSLARVIYPVEYDGGIVLQGFSSLLFPSALDSDSVQWHYISNKNSHFQLSTSVVADLPRVKGVDLEHLMRPRTFLGYCKTVNINLGTEQSGYDRIDYSPAADDRRGPELLASSASIGTSGMGVFGINASANITYPKGLLANIKIDHYEDILRTARGMPVLLYDAQKGEERGWLVPMLSAILHMAHAWASQVEPNLSHPIPHARPHWNGGQAAYEVFAEHSGLVLYQTLVEKTDYRFKDLTTRIWASLNSRIEEQKLVWKATPGAIVLESRRIRGWEVMDIVRPTPLSNMKMQEFRNDCGWNLLGEDILILFCQGLGEAIRPAEECRVCPVPKGLDYLTASVHCLQSLSKQRGAGDTCARITNHLYCQPTGPFLFEDCIHKRTSYCKKRPQVFSEIRDSSLKKNEGIGIVQTGAVLFGSRAAKLHKAVNGKKKVEVEPKHRLSTRLRNLFHQRRHGQLI